MTAGNRFSNRDIALGVVSVVAIAGLAFGISQMASANKLQDENARLQTILADKTKMENATLSRECSDKAEQVYKSGSYNANSMADSYVSHYEPKLSKCFIEVTTSSQIGDNFFKMKNLFDAYDGRGYGDYIGHINLKGSAGNAFVNQCDMTPIGKDKTYCKSEGEFDAFTKGYLE